MSYDEPGASDAQTVELYPSSWEPEPRLRQSLDDLPRVLPCLDTQGDEPVWDVAVDTVYSLHHNPMNETSGPTTPWVSGLTIRGFISTWQDYAVNEVLNNPVTVLSSGQPVHPGTWEPGSLPSGGQPTCVTFEYSIDRTPTDPPLSFQFPHQSVPYTVLVTSTVVRIANPVPPTPLSSTTSDISPQVTSKPTASAVSSSTSRASVIIPAVLVPLLVIGVLVGAFLVWRNKRRQHLAPSSAFRAAYPQGVSIPSPPPVPQGNAGPSVADGSILPTYAAAGSSAPGAYFPTEEKRPFLTGRT